MTPTRHLALFHVRAGARAALRATSIGVAVAIFVLGSAPEAAHTLMTIVLGLFGPPGGGAPNARIALAAGALALAASGARRVSLGASGWMRSLPIGGAEARRAAWVACAAATLPAALFALAGVVLTPTLYHASLSPARVLSLPVLLAAAGAAALRVERTGARLVALLALAAAALGTPVTLVAALGLLLAWDRWAGVVAPRAVVRRARAASPARGTRGGRLAAHRMAVRWAWRVVGVRAMAEAVIVAALPVGFCALVRANNPDLAPGTRDALARLGAGLGATFAAAAIAGPLLARRPPWPWARTLPWSAFERVLVDAAALLAPALAVGVASVAAYAIADGGAAEPGTIATTVGCAIAVAVCAAFAGAAALRAGAHRQTGAVGELAVVGVAAAVAVSLVPWVALLAPSAALVLGGMAARRERGGADAVRWNELRHGAEGDVGWIARS